MNILLLKDVAKVGNKGDVKNVSPGFARNFLIPRGLATLATKAALKIAGEERKKREEKVEKTTTTLESYKAALEKLELEFKRKTTKTGRLFAALTSDDILQELQKRGFSAITSSHIKFPEPIKKAGEHTIVIQLDKEEIKLKIKITKEEAVK